MPQFDPHHFFSQIFWAIVCFGCIWCLVHFWVMPRLRRVYAERSDQADQWSRQAQNIEKKVMDIMHDENDRLDKAQHENMKRLEHVKREIQDDLDKSAKAMHQKYEDHMKKASDQLDQHIKDMQSCITEKSPSLAEACIDRYDMKNEQNVHQEVTS